jgi:hypothetical protein
VPANPPAWGRVSEPSTLTPMTLPRHLRTSAAATAAAPVIALAIGLATALLVAVLITPAPASAGPYVNPSPAEIRGLLYAAAVAHDIPPKILYAVAYQESTWRQFDAAGDPLISSDGGIGILQVTTIPAGVDAERLKTDVAYNIDVGAGILAAKWGYAPSVFPLIGDGSRRCYEDWFFAVWAYNGWVAGNQYPYLIWAHVADGRGLWTGQAVTAYPASSLVHGKPPAVASVSRPQPEHWWSPVRLPRPVLSLPRVQRRVAAGARFSVSGTLSPRHPAGGHSVVLNVYRWSGSVWALRRTLLTTNRDAGDATRWAVSFALGKVGRWKLLASAVADADHSAATSNAAYFTVVR